MKNGKRIILLACLLLIISVLIPNISGKSQAAETNLKTYTVKATGLPYNNQYKKLNTYNTNTRQYYMLRSYLEQMEKAGGGTLVLSKGTYLITNTLYIPSHVTIILKDGVKLQKGNKTGTTKLTPTKSLIQLTAPSKSGVAGTVAKYSGGTGIKILGEGTAMIDLNYVKDAVAIVVGHNTEITIQGITFQKMNGGSFIKIGASKNIAVSDNLFQYHKDSETNSAEAISLEVPDAVTKAFSYPWSKNDKTENQNITIGNNDFNQLERAIGSTKYSEGKYQKNINIIGNNISKTDSHAVRILNWKDSTLKDNKFSDISNKEGSLKAILVSGAMNPTITKNVFTATDRAIQIMPWKNNNNGSSYKVTYNQIGEDNKSDMLKNTLITMLEYEIRYNKTYNEFTLDTEKWKVFDPSLQSFVLTETTEPFQNSFLNYSTYNSKTKQYYVIRSYLEQLERVGGGTLTLKAGTYEISNSLYVPSHVTINLEDGVIIKKTEQIGVADMVSSKSIFQLASPAKSKKVGVYRGYEGETDIHFIGNGTAIIDLNFVQDAFGIILGHNSDVVISGITFQNMYSGHFIELDASRNITIEDNKFLHHKVSADKIKEAINIDTPDKNTGGFNEAWTSYDCTPNKDILIRDNTFDDLERAIGTHKYSEGKYHENIQIINNKISNTTSDAIRIMNWTKPVITGNEIVNVGGGSGTLRAILASGLSSPRITDNTFSNVARGIQIMPWKNNGGGGEYPITYNSISNDELSLMLKNTLIRVGEKFLRINKTYDVFIYDTEKHYYSSEYIKY